MNDVKTYAKKPVQVRALQYTGQNKSAIETFVGVTLEDGKTPEGNQGIVIPTKEGGLTAPQGYFVVEGKSEALGVHYWPVEEGYFRDNYVEVG